MILLFVFYVMRKGFALCEQADNDTKQASVHVLHITTLHIVFHRVHEGKHNHNERLKKCKEQRQQ